MELSPVRSTHADNSPPVAEEWSTFLLQQPPTAAAADWTISVFGGIVEVDEGPPVPPELVIFLASVDVKPLRPGEALIGLTGQDERASGGKRSRSCGAHRRCFRHLQRWHQSAAGETVKTLVFELVQVGVGEGSRFGDVGDERIVVGRRFGEVGDELHAARVRRYPARYVQPDRSLVEGRV